MPIIMFDQVHRNQNYINKQSRRERLENLFCFIGILIVIFLAATTVIDVISVENDNNYLDSSAYLYDHSQE